MMSGADMLGVVGEGGLLTADWLWRDVRMR